MDNQNEMVKVETWTLILTKFESGPVTPIFYYNHIDDIFERKFSIKCAFLGEKECIAKEKELNIFGLESVKGTMDVPKDILIDSIMEVFTGN